MPAFNQPPPLAGYDVFTTDQALLQAVAFADPTLDTVELQELGRLAGTAEMIALGADANRYEPELMTHDRFGERIDEVRFHPSYHVLMGVAATHGLHAAPWRDSAPNAHLRRAIKFYLWSQVEAGHLCPVSMTYASVPALEHSPLLARTWTAKLAARAYDPRLVPISEKNSALCGMGMTERQGGSDVRANITRAVAIANGEYAIDGHKWFCSAPMSDAFLVLAQADKGLSCFFVPRVLADGSRNPFVIQRLKDKLGNRSNASSEVEFTRTRGWLVGEEGRGIQTIVEMVNGTRLDCIIGSAALMRQALAQAIHHATYRSTFGAKLIDHVLMQNVLADLALESEAATAIFVRLADATDDNGAPHSAALKRIGTAIGKYYVCKRAPAVSAEALECLGGNGYVEESMMPRLYREAPLNSIWEGSGNINALDVLRIVQKQPDAVEAFMVEVSPALSEPRIAQAVRALQSDIRESSDLEWRARSVVERMALVWQASLLLLQSPNYVSDGFIASRLGEGAGRTFGTLAIKTALRAIVDRAAPREP